LGTIDSLGLHQPKIKGLLAQLPKCQLGDVLHL
jgi:hypothetical protein